MSEEKVGILLVDDDPAVRGLARIILAHEGWQVVEAGCLREAFEKVRVDGFRPHIAVVDLCLPDGLGTELVEDLQQARAKAKIVYITGDPGWLRRLDPASHTVLAKPFTPMQLVVVVRAALNSMRPVVVIVEPEPVYQRLLVSALEHESVEIAAATSIEEGLLLVSQRGAAVLITPEPMGEAALARLIELRGELPNLALIALATDAAVSGMKWYDRKLTKPYSAQSVADAVRHGLRLKSQTEVNSLKGSEMHQDGDGQGHDH